MNTPHLRLALVQRGYGHNVDGSRCYCAQYGAILNMHENTISEYRDQQGDVISSSVDTTFTWMKRSHYS
jgi:hypothetical protein